MTDPRSNNPRLSLALRHVGTRGQATKHQLMLRVADAIEEVEQSLSIIRIAMERGDLELAKVRLQYIEKVLGCGDVVISSVDTDSYPHNKKRNFSSYEN